MERDGENETGTMTILPQKGHFADLAHRCYVSDRLLNNEKNLHMYMHNFANKNLSIPVNSNVSQWPTF